ncbi:MAG: box helicase domain protein, partial [Deltaproteobacteria bacterium]|nr:box helicase domain protein [Deltaproteobacteria bacterium]
AGRGRATEAVGLDQISEEVFRIVCDGSLLETMDRGQAFREAHTGAVLLHQGETYTVQEMDLKNHVIQARRADVDYYTRSLKIVDLTVLEELDRRRLGRFEAHFGKLEVTEQFIGYKVLKNEQTIATENLDLPPLVFRTTGLWFTVPEEIRRAVIEKNMHFGGGLHGIEHAMIGVMPLEVMCDRWDVGGLSTPGHPDTMQPTIFIYDGFEGGIGLTEKAYSLIPELMRLTLELVRDCPCAVGCPACVYSPKCGNDNKPLDKKAAAFILEGLLERMH